MNLTRMLLLLKLLSLMQRMSKTIAKPEAAAKAAAPGTAATVSTSLQFRFLVIFHFLFVLLFLHFLLQHLFFLSTVDGVTGFYIQGDGLTSQSFHEDLHASTKAKHKMESGFLLNIVIRQGTFHIKVRHMDHDGLSLIHI